MGANITVCPLTAASLGCLTALDLRSGIASQQKLSPETEVPAEDEVAGLDAYKIAVLVSVGLAILSLCF
jgi:hypothetical protein